MAFPHYQKVDVCNYMACGPNKACTLRSWSQVHALHPKPRLSSIVNGFLVVGFALLGRYSEINPSGTGGCLLAVIKSSRTEMAAGKVKSLERVCLASREISSDHPLPLSPDPTYLVFPGPVCSELSSLPPPSTLKAGFQLHPGEPSKNTNMTWLPCYSL